MQKTKIKQAAKAITGKTGKAGSPRTTGKTSKASKKKLTAAQREAKRLRDREYRSRVRAKKRGPATAPCVATADDVFRMVGRIVLRELAAKGLPHAGGMPVSCGNGVTSQDVVMPDGVRTRVTLVDVDNVDLLPGRSPLPDPLRRHLLRLRMAKEISDIVDSNAELS